MTLEEQNKSKASRRKKTNMRENDTENKKGQFSKKIYETRLPWWHSGYPTCQCRGPEFEPLSQKIPRATEQLSLCATTTEPLLQNL